MPGHDDVGEWDYNEGCANTKVSLADRAGLVMKFMSLPARMIYWSSTGFVTSPEDSTFDHVKNRTMGYIAKSTSIPQLRMVLPIKPIRLTLKDSRRQAKGLHNYNGLFEGSGFSARWIHETPDRMPEDPVIIYLHGGGYAFKISPPQVNFIITAARALRRYRVSILVLDYTVTPFGKYPAQLTELANCYNSLTEHGNCQRPILLGDSCGANLALALLQHIKYPVDGVPRCEVSTWASGMVSPWVSLVTNNHGSYYEFRARDLIDGPSLEEMCKSYCDESELSDPVVNPIMGSVEYWDGVIPERQFTVWGGNECLRDSCREFAEKHSLTNTFEESRGLHDCLINDLRRPGPRFVMNSIVAWLDPAKPVAMYVEPISQSMCSETDTAATTAPDEQHTTQSPAEATWRWTWRPGSMFLGSGSDTDIGGTVSAKALVKPALKAPLNPPAAMRDLYTIHTHSDPELTTYDRSTTEFEDFSPKRSRTALLKSRLSLLATDSMAAPNRAMSFCRSPAFRKSRAGSSVPALVTSTGEPVDTGDDEESKATLAESGPSASTSLSSLSVAESPIKAGQEATVNSAPIAV